MDTKKDGGNEKCLKGKKKFCEKKIIYSENILAFFKFWKDNTTLNLLINITRFKIFSIWTTKC